MPIMNLPQGMGLGTFKVATGVGGNATTAGPYSVSTGLNTVLGFAITPTSEVTFSATLPASGGTVTVNTSAAATFSWIAIGY